MECVTQKLNFVVYAFWITSTGVVMSDRSTASPARNEVFTVSCFFSSTNSSSRAYSICHSCFWKTPPESTIAHRPHYSPRILESSPTSRLPRVGVPAPSSTAQSLSHSPLPAPSHSIPASTPRPSGPTPDTPPTLPRPRAAAPATGLPRRAGPPCSSAERPRVPDYSSLLPSNRT